MDNIKNYNPAEAETLDSREVAEMVEKQHRHLLRDINGYIEEMEKTGEPNFGLSSKLPKINPSDFFIPSTYTSEQGERVALFPGHQEGLRVYRQQAHRREGDEVYRHVRDPLQYHGGAREGRYRRKDRKER